uniref:Uncharacterized protein n=1 Tax=Nelumbo nucifera TaxID=4432 RepID=A0A822XUK9_NELNU|nr:TPA_asm: hypothetical protein HUJ06_026778 [Nelumbo nucifera]
MIQKGLGKSFYKRNGHQAENLSRVKHDLPVTRAIL